MGNAKKALQNAEQTTLSR